MIREKLKAALRRVLGRAIADASPRPGGAPAPSAPAPSPPLPPAPATLDVERVAKLIDERIRPALQADGGDIELVAVVGPDVHVRLQGACRGCPGAAMTLRMGVEAQLREEIPGFGRVVDVG